MNLHGKAWLRIAFAGLAVSCMADNSLGPDVVPGPEGQGGAAGQASGGAGGTTSTGSGGATASGGASGAGMAGAGDIPGMGGGSGAGGASGAGGRADGGAGGRVADGGAGRQDGSVSGGGAGSGVVSTGDAGQGGPSLCPVAGTTLCDGFEGAAPGATGSDWTLAVTGPDTMVVDTTKFYRGSKSMHFTGTTKAYIQETRTITGTTKATTNAFWGRYFIWFNAGATPPAAHYVFGTMDGINAVNAAGNQFHFVGGTRGTIQTQIRITSDLYTGGGTTPLATDPKVPTTADGWQCWEWQIQPNDSFQFYINGALVPEMTLTAGKSSSGTTFPLPTIKTLQLGWEYFGGGPSVSGWIDEVAIGPERIGCGN